MGTALNNIVILFFPEVIVDYEQQILIIKMKSNKQYSKYQFA